MVFSSRELTGVAKQATLVITDYAVSFRGARELEPGKMIYPEDVAMPMPWRAMNPNSFWI